MINIVVDISQHKKDPDWGAKYDVDMVMDKLSESIHNSDI